MREKVLIIKNRDWSDYRFDTHKWIDLAGADYLTDNDDISVIFFGPITSPKVTAGEWGVGLKAVPSHEPHVAKKNIG